MSTGLPGKGKKNLTWGKSPQTWLGGPGAQPGRRA